MTLEPITVVADGGSTGLWAQWGPLIGVLVGGAIGFIGQVITGRLQRLHDIASEDRKVRRDLYVRVVTSLIAAERAVADERSGPAKPESETRRVWKRLVDFGAHQAEVGVLGDLRLFAEMSGVFGRAWHAYPGGGVGTEEEWERLSAELGDGRARVLAIARADLTDARSQKRDLRRMKEPMLPGPDSDPSNQLPRGPAAD